MFCVRVLSGIDEHLRNYYAMDGEEPPANECMPALAPLGYS